MSLTPPDLADCVLPDVAAHAAEIQALRRDLHAHPELCFEEVRTSDLVADTLTGWGIEVHRGLGKTGVVGVIQGRPGPRAVGLRADMDALPMTEHNTFAHASRHRGACTPVGTMGTRPCSWQRRGICRRTAISMARSTSSSSRQRKAAEAPAR